ncbi:MAG: hypothetical protein ACI86H_001259 [bacterium]|jgi:hypothetical protein
MKRNFILLITIILGLVLTLPTSSFAKEKGWVELQALGATTGVGAHLGVHLTDYIFIGLQATAYNTDFESDQSDSTVTGTIDLKTQLAILRVSPFSGAFYLQAGAVNRNWELVASGTEQVGDSGTTVSADYSVKVTFPEQATNIGIGWNWMASFGLSGGLGIGVITGAPAKAELTIDRTVYTTVTDAQIEEEEQNIEDELKGLTTFPYITVSIGFTF